MDLKELGWEGVNWIHLEMFEYRWQDLLNMAMNLWVPKNINFLLS
jgi:hypothetical protein